MAKALPNPLLANISGKLGNAIFQRGATSTIIRYRIKGKGFFRVPNYNMAAIQAGRVIIRQRQWRASITTWVKTLTQSQRDAWAAFAVLNPIQDRFGQDVVLSGFAMFQSLNIPLLAAELPGIADPPAALGVSQQGNPTGTSTVAGNVLTLDSYAPAPLAGEYLEIASGWPLSPGQSKFPARLTLLDVLGAPATPPISFYSAYIAQFQTPRVDQKIPLQIRFLNSINGDVSAPTNALLTTT